MDGVLGHDLVLTFLFIFFFVLGTEFRALSMLSISLNAGLPPALVSVLRHTHLADVKEASKIVGFRIK